jgi:putative Ig domain-containing protein
VLAASTPNDGSESVTLPNIGTATARVKVEAVGNIFFDLSNSNFTVQALPVVTNDAPGGSVAVQYSDVLAVIVVTATDADSAGSALTASVTGLPAGVSLVEGSGGSSVPGTRTWTVAGTVTAAPGTYNVTVTVTDDTEGLGSTSFTIVVNREDAEVTYTGDMLAFTAAGGSSANVVLRATVRDSSLIPAFNDSWPGLISNATVTFKEGATTLCGGPLVVTLLNGDPTTGTATCTAALSVDAHEITVLVNNFYVGTTTALIQVAQPDGSFITGGGYVFSTSSAGSYTADAGSKTHFAFNAKYNKNNKSLQGQVNVRFQSGGRLYRLKSTATDSLGIAMVNAGSPCTGSPSATCFGVADFRAKANLSDVTGPEAVSVAGNLSLRLTLTDKGEPGSSDSIGVTVWDGSTLVFSSKWTGAQTVEQLLAGGNTVVH